MKSLIVANWKMNPPTLKDAKALLSATKKALQGAGNVSVVVAPPAVFVRTLAEGARKGKISFGVQNAHFDAGGAHTGEISMDQAREAKASYVIVGHAERRAMGETNVEIGKKVAAALKAGVTPIFCIGERERDPGGSHFLFVRDQIVEGLAETPPNKIAKIIVAYEPVWAIGATETMLPRDMHEMSIFIRKSVVERYGDGGYDIKILYGGSVDATSAPHMLRNGDVIGLLVGRASAEIGAVTELIAAVAAA